MITVEFDTQKQLLHINYSGEINLTEIIDNITHIFMDLQLPSKLHILEDGTQAFYNLPQDANEQILKEMSKHVDKFGCVFVAFVQNKPLETAVNLEYEHDVLFPNFHYKVFSSRDNALKWLGK